MEHLARWTLPHWSLNVRDTACASSINRFDCFRYLGPNSIFPTAVGANGVVCQCSRFFPRDMPAVFFFFFPGLRVLPLPLSGENLFPTVPH